MVASFRTLLCSVAVLAGAAAALLDAQQGRGARPGGPGGAGGRPGGPGGGGASSVERIVVHGKSLEGNLEGDSPDREATVYLPPSYAGADKNRRYPVIYLLHDFGARDDAFTAQIAKLRESADRLDGAQGFSSSIVVTPNAFTLHKGSMYSSSPTIGDWEKFIAEDLVAYMDSHYRTLANRTSRGLAGHAMGGHGALRIGMKRADVFMSLYVMSACCLTTSDVRADSLAAAEAIKTREQAEEAARGNDSAASVGLAWAAAWSPNPKNPPLFLDLPGKGGGREAVLQKWTANMPIEMLERYAAGLKSYYAVAIDVGTKDSLVASNRQLHEAMTRLRIPHAYEEYEGDHTNRVGDRIERHMLPFFSKNLVAPANPTSPLPK